jgi:predicted DNA-binding WGR domain protein
MGSVPQLPLAPLSYHVGVAEYLQRHEADLWKWFSADRFRAEQSESVRLDLLKSTYRLERDSSPALYAAADEVAAKLDLAAPLTFYQSQSAGGLNASLAYVPGEAHIVLQGRVTDWLTPAELRSVLGHELAHFLLLERWQEYLVILSVCYGRAPDGKMRMNFGPINQVGGERRLNVAFSRAKHHMCVVSSIRHADITNEYNDGANALRNYLRYAAACSAGDAGGSQRVLRELAIWRDVEQPDVVRHGAVVTQLAAELKQRGYAVDLGVGMSHFRCDLAVRRHGELRYRLGVLVDTEEHYRQEDLLERELLRPQLLRGFGWHLVHVLSADWVRERQAVISRLLAAIEEGKQPGRAEAQDEGEDCWDEFDGPAPAVAASPPEDAPAKPGPVGEPAATGKRYFEFVGGASRKFWEISRSGHTLSVHFGRIGTSGQTQQKICADEATAEATARRLVREKLGKGYVEKSGQDGSV